MRLRKFPIMRRRRIVRCRLPARAAPAVPGGQAQERLPPGCRLSSLYWVFELMDLKQFSRDQLQRLRDQVEQELENRKVEERLRWEIRRRGRDDSKLDTR